MFSNVATKEAYHELAHLLDGPENFWSTQMALLMGVQHYRGYWDSSPGEGQTNVEEHGNFSTSYAEVNPRDDLAESVMVYFLGNPDPGYENWSDDEPQYQSSYGEFADSRWYPVDRADRYDFRVGLWPRLGPGPGELPGRNDGGLLSPERSMTRSRRLMPLDPAHSMGMILYSARSAGSAYSRNQWGSLPLRLKRPL